MKMKDFDARERISRAITLVVRSRLFSNRKWDSCDKTCVENGHFESFFFFFLFFSFFFLKKKGGGVPFQVSRKLKKYLNLCFFIFYLNIF